MIRKFLQDPKLEVLDSVPELDFNRIQVGSDPKFGGKSDPDPKSIVSDT
jgi:hypothetical protein